MNTAFKTLLKLQERIYQTTRDLIGYEQERNKEGGVIVKQPSYQS